MALPLLNAAAGGTGLAAGPALGRAETVTLPSGGGSQSYPTSSVAVSGGVEYCPLATSTRSQRPVRVRYTLDGHVIGTWKLISPSWVNARVPSRKSKSEVPVCSASMLDCPSGSHLPSAR